jgi:hypothetical protein
MYPGLSAADCRVAELRYQQMLVEGQHQQFVAGAHPGASGTRPVSTSLRQQLGTLLVHAGQRLQTQGVQAVTRERLDTVAIGEPAAIG